MRAPLRAVLGVPLALAPGPALRDITIGRQLRDPGRPAVPDGDVAEDVSLAAPHDAEHRLAVLVALGDPPHLATVASSAPDVLEDLPDAHAVLGVAIGLSDADPQKSRQDVQLRLLVGDVPDLPPGLRRALPLEPPHLTLLRWRRVLQLGLEGNPPGLCLGLDLRPPSVSLLLAAVPLPVEVLALLTSFRAPSLTLRDHSPLSFVFADNPRDQRRQRSHDENRDQHHHPLRLR